MFFLVPCLQGKYYHTSQYIAVKMKGYDLPPPPPLVYTPPAVSVHLKCIGAKELITSSTARVWEDHFITVSQSTVLHVYWFTNSCSPFLLQLRNTIPVNRDIISDFKMGLQLIDQLNLACEVQFTPQLMVDFLVGDNCIRPLAHIR